MPKAIKLESATHVALNFAWLIMAVVVAYACGVALSWLLQRFKGRSAVIADIDVLTRRPVRAMLMVIAATTAVHHTSTSASAWRGGVDHVLLIALMATYTWLTASLVLVAERRIRTQISLLRRLVVAVVVVFGLAAVLMTFPAFSNIGKTLFASAGVLSVVAGLAAQTSLAAVFAGIQIAFSDAVRVGDVVVVEEEWGRIEEITLTYVVVHLWDERRLVLPCTYFIKTPFQNWTRNAGALFDLRCNVREGMVAWLQRTEAGALPRRRIEHSQGSGVPDSADQMRSTGRPRADSGFFSGSPGAEQRGRAFSGPAGDQVPADRREFARPSSRG